MLKLFYGFPKFRGRERIVPFWCFFFLSAACSSVTSQQRQDLVGRWVTQQTIVGVTTRNLAQFNEDSSYTWTTTENGVDAATSGRYRVGARPPYFSITLLNNEAEIVTNALYFRYIDGSGQRRLETSLHPNFAESLLWDRL